MMRTRNYRLTVVGCVLSWFLLGLHFPVVHEITAHGRAPHWSVLVIVACIAVAAVGSLWALLRGAGRSGKTSGPTAAAG
jgi:hypothetical protein